MDAERSAALELLAQPGWAWRLAHGLCRDEAEAQDALGEARLVALRGPVARGGGDSLRAWVARVVRNAVRRGRRGERRRTEREAQAAREEALPAAERVLEREEARRALVGALLSLPEPYRGTLIAHYYDGLRPNAIAARAGLPPSTVRNRLARGRALLRCELERSDAREPRDWLAAVAPLLVRPDSMVPLVLGGLAVGTKATLAIAGAAALALLGSLWWWNAKGPVEPGLQGVPATVELVDAGEASRQTPVEGAAPDASRVLATSIPEADTEPLVVRVVDPKGEGLKGAIVNWATSSAMTEYWRVSRGDAPPDLERWIADRGRADVTDERGECRLPANGGDLAVCARSGDLWNWTFAKVVGPNPIVLVLEASHSLSIEVVDVEGRPAAGVPVGLFMVGVDRGETKSWEGRTGVDGRATIHKLEHSMHNGANPSDLPFVGLVGPLGNERVAIDPLAPPHEPVRLVLPAYGSLRVRLAAREGSLTAEPFWVGVTELSTGRTSDLSVRGKRHSLTAWPESGTAEVVWTHVGLGLELLVEAQPPGALRMASVRVRGPKNEGEEVLVELELDPVGSRIAARLVDSNGTAVPTRYVEMYLQASNPTDARSERLARSSTDAAGRVVLPVPDDLRGVQSRWRLVAYNHPAEQFVVAARSILPPNEGELDLGDVVLEEPKVFVAGQVLDARGVPAPEVQVSVARWTHMGGEGAQEVWTWNWAGGVSSPSTDAEGRFHLRDDPPSGRYAIAARSSEFGFGEFVPFERGQQDLFLRLPSVGGLAGRLLLPEGVEAARLRVTLAAQHPTRASRPPVIAPRPDGSFDVADLEAGAYQVHVRRVWDDETEPLAVVDDVRVAEGETRLDPRLDPLDLREGLHALALEIVDARGMLVPRGHVALRPHGVPSPCVRVGFERGSTRLCGAGLSSDIDVVAPGYRTLRVEDVRGARRIELEPGFEVRVRLPAGIALPDAPDGMRLGFWHADHPRRQTERVFDVHGQPLAQWGGVPQVEVALEGNAPFDVVLPQAGSWSVAWVVRVRHPDGGESNWGVRADPSGNSFVVPADGSPVEVLLAGPDAEDLARVLRELEGG